MECWKCGKLGHKSFDCWQGKGASYVEADYNEPEDANDTSGEREVGWGDA